MKTNHYKFQLGIFVCALLCGTAIYAEQPTTPDATALSVAAYASDISTVRQLLEKGAPVNGRNGVDNTPLHFAAGATPVSNSHYKPDPQIAELLLAHGADINAQNKGGYTPLIDAVSNGASSVVRVLVEHGANVNIQTQFGDTALCEAILRHQTDTVNLLLDHRADVNGIRDANGRTPLMLAIAAVPPLWQPPSKPHDDLGFKLLVWYVHFYGVDTKIFAKAMEIPGDIAPVHVLLEHSPEINVTDKMGQTPLTLAAMSGHALLVKDLLAHGANPNVHDHALADATPLILAIAQESEPMIKALIEKGADPKIKDNFKKDAFAYASQHGAKWTEILNARK